MGDIPHRIVRRAVDDMIDGLYEMCGIRRVGWQRSVGGIDEWLSWGGIERDLARWADDGGRHGD